MIESPRWLVKKGRLEEARKNLAWVRNLSPEHEYVEKELSDIASQLRHERESLSGQGAIKGAWKEISSKKMRFRVIFALAMKWMSNLTG